LLRSRAALHSDAVEGLLCEGSLLVDDEDAAKLAAITVSGWGVRRAFIALPDCCAVRLRKTCCIKIAVHSFASGDRDFCSRREMPLEM
jgi:hypothetical protein